MRWWHRAARRKSASVPDTKRWPAGRRAEANTDPRSERGELAQSRLSSSAKPFAIAVTLNLRFTIRIPQRRGSISQAKPAAAVAETTTLTKTCCQHVRSSREPVGLQLL